MKSDEAIALLEKAFAGVRLEDGVSLRQAELADVMSYQQDERWDRARQLDVIDDWRKIPARDLEDLCYLAHVDAKGFRYYIPALLSLLARDYDPSWPNVIQVLHALSPKEDSWRYSMERYSLLSPNQKSAIAEFLTGVSSFVNLRGDDAVTIAEALRSYWEQFLRHEERA